MKICYWRCEISHFIYKFCKSKIISHFIFKLIPASIILEFVLRYMAMYMYELDMISICSFTSSVKQFDGYCTGDFQCTMSIKFYFDLTEPLTFVSCVRTFRKLISHVNISHRKRKLFVYAIKIFCCFQEICGRLLL
jgi:hypothetical protein